MDTLVYGTGEGAVEKALYHETAPSWGIRADVEALFQNQRPSQFSFRTIEAMDPAALQFAAEDRATIYLGRSYNAGTGEFSGGTLYFQGWFDDPKQVTDGARQWIQYTVLDVWWMLSRHVFSQIRNQITGREGGIPTGEVILTPIYTPEVFLGEAIDVDGLVYLQTNGDQIREVLNWFNECFNPTKRGATSGRDDAQDVVQIGTIDPKLYIPVTRQNSIFCSEAINHVLRLSPDAVVAVDHTTQPPTLNVRTLAKWNYGTVPPTFVDYTNLPEVEIDITVQQERQIQLSKKVTQKIGSVILYYAKLTDVDGQGEFVFSDERYPVDASDFDPLAMRQYIELAGSKVQHVTVDVVAPAASDALSADAATRRAWWIAHDKSLQDAKVDAASVVVNNPAFIDENGDPVDLGDFPNELTSQSLPGWVGASVKKVTAVAEIAFKKYLDADHKVKDTEHSARPVRHSITLTTAVTKTYVGVQQNDPGETMPAGLAEMIYRAGNALQHAGTIEFQSNTLRSDIYVGCRLKLVGPNHTFSNLLVQTVKQQPHFNRTTVTFGPANPLTVSLWLEMIRAVRMRLVYNMPSGRGDGTGPGENAVDYTADGSRENTSHGTGGVQTDRATFQHPTTAGTGGSGGTGGTGS